MKRFIHSWLWSALCLSLLFAGACSDDDTEAGSSEPVPPTLTTENIPENGLHFLYFKEAPRTFQLNVDAPWEITKTDGWFVVSPNKGKAGQGIVITVEGDFNTGDARTGEFTIRANSGSYRYPCLTEKTVQLSQDAFLAAGISLTGIEEQLIAFPAIEPQPVNFKVNASYDWTLAVEDESWVTVSPKSGKANTETVVTVSPQANSLKEKRTSKITVTAFDPINPENKAEESIDLKQSAYFLADSHEVGHVFLSDDFAWITENWVEPYSKYGWPGVKVDGQNGNEFALTHDGIKAVVAQKGYTHSASVYARYEGVVKLGKTAVMGSITTPALSAIDEGKAATLLVQFDAAAYASAGGTVDNGDDKMYISVNEPATIGENGETEIGIEVKNIWEWKRYSILVHDANAETKITFGCERSLKCRLYLDNISITRTVDEDAVAPEPQQVDTPLDKEIVNMTDASLINSEGQLLKTGGTLLASIRINRAWTAETDCDWLTITAVKCGATGEGANNGATLSGGKATVTATGLPYNNTQIKAEANVGSEVRTGHIVLRIDGESEPVEIPVVQESGLGVQITGLEDNALELGYDASGAGNEVKFSATGSHDWIIGVPQNDTWYEVSPLQGAAGQKVEVTVKAKQSNLCIRRFGSFSITITPDASEPISQQIEVSQQTAPPGFSKWDMTAPVQWSFSAKDMVKYDSDFKGGQSEATGNALPAEQGVGYISYTHTAPADPDGKCSRIVGGTGHPYVTGAWPGDYWSFTVPVESLAAGTKVHFKGLTRTSATGHKFWKMEYNDGGVWKPAAPLLTETIDGQEVSYTHAMNSNGKTNVTVDLTVTYENALSGSAIEFRFTCMANWMCGGNPDKGTYGPLDKPNGGTSRWAGAGTADSPMIEIVQ